MTLVKSLLEQLKISAVSLRLQIPESISSAVVTKVNLTQDRSVHTLPESIIYAESIDEKRFHSETHLANVNQRGWKLEIVKVIRKTTDEEVFVAVINKIGSIRTRFAASDHKNGNNPIRQKAIRR
jgi:hypothetical protein